MPEETPLLAPISPGDTDIYGIAIDELMFDGESILDVEWTVGAGLNLDAQISPATFRDSNGRSYEYVRLIKVSGAKLGGVYPVSAKFSLSSGAFGNRTINRAFRIPCLVE